jgi:Asp-tRNA(Asn)/Glu-tRNA(Gln) amidotransferase A subunit family amidase
MREQIRERKLSPVELMDAHFRQIAKCNPGVNAFVRVFEDQARDAAKRAEQQGGDGPLHGIPVTIKDSLHVAGSPTLVGSRFSPVEPAANDSAVAARLKAAGAIVIGKTNCPEFLMNYETDNYVTGRTNNPWDLERTPGGSSGGESAAIAACMSAAGMGSDAGGSTRVPAHCTGIAGLKPTPGRISGAGHSPSVGNPEGMLGVVGPMARSAEDLRILFDVLAGYDIEDPFSIPLPLTKPDLTGLNVGVMEQFYKVPVQEPISKALHAAVAALDELKIAHAPFRPAGLERAPNVWWFFFGEMNAPFIKQTIQGREDEAHPIGVEWVNTVAADRNITGVEVVEKFAMRDRMRAALLEQMQEFPVILSPACGVPAWRHRQRRWHTEQKDIGLLEAMMPVTLFNITSLPAVTIPFGTTEEGIPVGVQIAGRPYEEEVILEVAQALERVRGPFPLPPGY